MKNLLTSVVILLLSVSVQGQNKSIQKIFDRNKGADGFTSIVITRHMFDLFSELETQPDDDYLNLIKNLDGINILTASEPGVNSRKFYNTVLKELHNNRYQELMTVHDTDQDVEFFTREKKGQVVELLMLIGAQKQTTLVWITGIIDMKTISKLADNLGIEGMDRLNKIDK